MANVPRQPHIAVLGSINMDLVVRCRRLPRPGETVLADEAREVPGGKGANQAVAAARLGARVSMIGRVGTDAFSQRLLLGLAEEGVETGFVVSSDCGSGLAIVAVDDAGENAITVIPGANGRVSPGDVEAAAGIIRDADVLLMQLEIPLESVLAGIALAHQSKTRVILDPAPAPAKVPVGLFAADVLTPNQSEAAALLGREAISVEETTEAARKLAGLGPGCAIITLGAEGVALCSADGQCTRIPSIRVHAVDTTAAGDAFAAALGVRLAEGASLEEAAGFACVAGALAASRPGAQPAMPRREEVASRFANR